LRAEPALAPPSLPPRRLLREWLLVGLALTLLAAALVASGVVRRLDYLLYDLALITAPPPPPDDVVVIGIDEASLAALGPWPWPRARHAAAIDRLAAAGARSIGYDVLFAEPAADDAALDAAIRRAAARGTRVVLPLQFDVPGRDGRAYDELLPVVGRGAAAVGHSAVHPDADGVLRSLDLAVDGSRRWPHVAALLADASPPPGFVAQPASAPPRRVGPRLVGFRGAPGSFRTLPFRALLAGEVPPAWLKDRIVLVGATAAGLNDQYATPTLGETGLLPGVEIEASFVADLTQGRRLERAGAWAGLVLALAALWLAMAALLRLRPGRAAAASTALAVLVVVGAALLLRLGGWWVAPGPALIVVLLAQPLWAWRRLAVVNRWMVAELAELGNRTGLVSRRRAEAPADPVTRSTQLLAATIDRVEELQDIAEAAIRGLPDATLLVDRLGGIAVANTAAEALFGPVPTLAAVSATFPALPPLDGAALADPASPWHGESHARDGSIRDIRATPWRVRDGLPLGWIMRFADITALRRAEAAREEALQLLTHDMRAPQASILALIAAEPGLPPALAQRLSQLARRTVALADGYLQLARAEAGGQVMSEVDLAAIVTEAIDELWPQSRAASVRITGEGLDEEALLTGNYQLLLRAAVNLIGNAVKFAPAGSEVECQLAAAGEQWRLDVVDHGPGVDPAVRGRLFGRFRAGPDAEGVGLGLAFVRSVATSHGGSIACTDTPGGGATFTLRLPR